MRLGSYPCILTKRTKTLAAYREQFISERHRHRYEVNNTFRDMLAEHGLVLSGVSPDGRLVEIVELVDHPWFVGCQFHPELKSRLLSPHPLFKAFVAAAVAYRNGSGEAKLVRKSKPDAKSATSGSAAKSRTAKSAARKSSV